VPAEIRLIATDLDGTLIGSANEFPLYDAFKARLEELRETGHVSWAACTGRTRASFNDFFHPMRAMGITPEFIILRHAYIFKLTRVGYLPRLFWNLHIFHQVQRHRFYAREALRHWREMIMGAAVGVRTADRRGDELRLQFDTDESAHVAGRLLKQKLEPYRHLQVFAYMRHVEVRPVPFTKGLAVAELAEHLGLGPENVLTIGNGHNDVSMFDPEVAQHCGCPANSEAEVMEAVHRRGGHIARERSLTGVMEILDAYRHGSVESSLPETFSPSPNSHGRPSRRRGKHGRSPRRIKLATAAMLISMVYITLLVFAHFELIPLSGVITKPYDALMRQIERLLDLFYSAR
jgi:HAD superfamily hydrolase (TIGR01484 family)